MSDVEVLVEMTPNPNSMKFTLNRIVIEKGNKTYTNPEAAKDSPLAQRLLAIPGVKTVFFLGNFISVGRDPAGDWEVLVPQIESALKGYFQNL